MLSAAEMYVKGVSTRSVEKVLAEFGIEGLSSTQVSRAAAMLDEELEAWRNRSLGRFRYLFLDALMRKPASRRRGRLRRAFRHRHRPPGLAGCRRLRRVLRAEVHWRAFLESLVARGLQSVEFVTSDDHSELKPPAKPCCPAPAAALPVSPRQNAIHHVPNLAIRKAIGEELRAVWDAPNLGRAEEELKRLVAKYRTAAPKLAGWLENNVPEGLAVFKLPREHWLRMRTSNPIERSIQQELKRRTQKIRVFPNEASLIRLVSAILVEIDEQWAASQ